MRPATLINSENIAGIDWDESYFKWCDFENCLIEGGLVASDFVDCSFKNVEWYWSLFSGSNFVHCHFSDCVFRGTSFPDTRFVECTLTNCLLVKDNLGGDCDFSEAIAYGCSVQGGEGFKAVMR